MAKHAFICYTSNLKGFASFKIQLCTILLLLWLTSNSQRQVYMLLELFQTCPLRLLKFDPYHYICNQISKHFPSNNSIFYYVNTRFQ